MKKMINKFMVAAISLATLLITGSAWAATPVAVWEGETLADTTAINNITLSYNNSAEFVAATGSSPAYIRIKNDATKGLWLANRNWSSQNITVILKYSDFPGNTGATGDKDRVLIVVGGQNNTTDPNNQRCDYYGVLAAKEGTGVFPMWAQNGGRWSGGAMNTAIVPSFSTEIKQMALAITHSSPNTGAGNGLSCYIDGVASYNNATLRGDIYTRDVGIFGLYYNTSTTVCPAVGAKVYGIAVFNQKLSETEIAAFKWPIRWVGEDGANWSVDGNWSTGVVPASGDTVFLDSDDIVNVDSAAVTTGVTVYGSGTLKYVGTGNTLPTMPAGITTANGGWTGKVWLNGYGTSNTCNFNLNNFGNANSIVSFTGITGYINPANTQASIAALELIDENGAVAFTQNNGNSNNTCKIPKLLGSGTLSDGATSGATQRDHFVDGSEFRGSITLTQGRNVWFGGSLSLTSGTAKTITVGSDATVTVAKGKTWQANSGITINGTLCGAGTLTSATTLGATAVLKPTNGGLTITGALTQTEGCSIDASDIDVTDGADFYPLVSLASAPASYPAVSGVPTGYEEIKSGAVIGIKKTGSDVTVVSDWAGLAAAIEAGKEYIIAGAITDGSGTATLTKATTIELLGGITGGVIANGGYALTLKTEATLSVSTQLTGAGAVHKTGAGTLTFSCSSGNPFTGGFYADEGTSKATGNNRYGAVNNASTSKLYLAAGATLDMANTDDASYWIISYGGTITNSGNDFSGYKRRLSGIELHADTLITGNSIWMTGANGGAITVALNDYTLTVRMNSGKFFSLRNTTITGEGKIRVESGVFGECEANQNAACFTAANATIELLAGTTLKTLWGTNSSTVKNIILHSGFSVSGSNKLIVTGLIDVSDMTIADYKSEDGSKYLFDNDGNLTVKNTTTFKFPDDAEVDVAYKLAGNTLNVESTPVKTYAYIGEDRKLVALTYDTTNKTVSYALAEPKTWTGGAGNSNWSDPANWSDGTKPASGDFVKLGDNDVVNVDETIASGVTIQGSGRIIFTDYAKIPTGSWVLPDWTGTLELKNCTKESGCRVDLLGNQNSSICFNGFTGYVFGITGVSAFPIATFKNIEIGEGGLNVTGGFSSSTYSSINGNLIGSGTITMSATCSSSQSGYEFVGDSSGFSGSVNAAKDTSHFYMNVGFETERKTDYNLTNNRHIVVGEGVTVGIGADKTWTSDQGVHVYGTIAGSGTLASATTFGEDATIKPAVGGLKFGNTITGSVTINCADIVAEDVNYAALITMTGASKSLPSYTLENATGYVAAEKEGVLYLVKKEVRDFYSKWDAAPAILTWKGTGSSFHQGDFELFDKMLGEPTTTVYDGDGSSVTIIPGQTSVINPSWRVWSYQNNYYSVAPGYVLRFEKDKGYVGTNIDASFAPFDVGGILVEKGATGFGLSGNGRKFALGDPEGVTETWTVINEDFTIDRDASTAQSGTEHVALRGIVNIDVASGKTLTFNAASAKHGITTTDGSALKMHGEGKMVTKVLVATGAVTLDYSNLAYNRGTAFIEGALTIDNTTQIKLPANAVSPWKLATSVTGGTDGDRMISIGNWTGIAKVSFANGEMTFKKIGNGTEADPYVVSTEADLNGYAAKAPSDGSEITYVKVVTPTGSFFFTLENAFNVPTARPVSLIVDADIMSSSDYVITIPQGATLYLSSTNESTIPGIKNEGMLYANNITIVANGIIYGEVSLYTTNGGRSEICGGTLLDKKVVDAGSTIALGGNVTFGDAADANTIELADGTTQVVAKDSNDVAYAGPNLKLVYAEALGRGQTLVSGILSDTVKAKFSFFVGETEVTNDLNYNAEAGTITTSTLNAQVVRNGGDPEMFEDLPAALDELESTDTGVTITLLSDYEDSETELVAACDIAIASEHTLTAKFDLANGKVISYPAGATITFAQDAANYRIVTKDGVTSVKLNGATSYTWTGAIDNVWAKDGNWSPVVGYPGLYAGDTATFPAFAAESVITLPANGVTIATLTGAFKIALDGVEKPTASAPVTLIACNASGATVTPETEVEGYYLKTDATGLTYHSNLEFLRHGYAFENNLTAESGATATLTFNGTQTYTDGVRTRALQFTNGQNYGTGFGFGDGDFTIFAVIKAPTDANKCIFSVGGQKGTAGMLGLRTAGADSVAVFTKDGTDLITVSVEDSATAFHYYALKYDSTAHTIALSVDGGEFGTPVAYTSSTAGQFQFGGIHSGGTSGKTDNATNGAIDEFQLYTKKLATEQIQALGAAFEPNTWKGVNGGAWNVASNWSYDTVPAAGESVVIPTGDTAEAYKIVLDNNATVSLGLVKITGAATSFEFENGEVTMGELKSSVDILVGANDTLIFPNRNESIMLAANKAIKGSGRVVMVGNGLADANSIRMDSAGFTGVKDADNWTGTLEIRNWCGKTDANYSKFGNFYGNANSTICFNGFKGYVYASDFDPIKAYEIGADGVEFVGQFSSGNIGFLGDLIGSGDLKLTLTGNNDKDGYLRFVGNSSGYTGSFSFAENNAFPISLIPSTDTTMPLAEFSQRMIILAVEAGEWMVNGDVEVIAGASFDTTKAPTINGKIKFDSNIVVKTTETPSEEGVLFINDTQLTPGTVSALAVTVKVGDVVQTGTYHPVTTAAGVVAKIVNVTSWSGEVQITESQNINAVLVTGNCTVKGIGDNKKVTLGSIAIGDGMTLTLDNVTIEVNELNVLPQAVKLVNGAHLVVNDQMTMVQLAANETLEMEAGTQYTIYNVPNFNASSTIKITNAASLQPGNYLLMDWSNWPNPDLMGYGKPQLNVTGYTGAEGSIRLIPEVYKLWLQVRSAAEMARPALTIEPIGDSITEGLNNAGGSGKNYRIPLINKLSLAGYNVKSVGYWKNNGSSSTGSFDPSGALTTNPDWIYHSGKGSARAGAVSGGNARVRDAWANDIDVGGAPDIVLLHIGINDMLNNGNYNDTNGTNTYAYLTNIVTGVLRDRPDVKLVMSSPMANAHGHQQQTATYADEPGKNDKNNQFCKPLHEMCLAFYNAVKAGELLSEIPGAADRLFFADQYLAVQPSWYDDSKLYLNDGSDHCHPNWLGHDLMAETWFEQITNAFPLVDGPFNAARTDKGTHLYGAENNVPAEYRKGFKKVRVFNTSLTGTEQLTPGTPVTYDTTDSLTPDEAAVAKVGYYVEYVRATSTTNIHRFVWVDMDAFGGKNVADIGIPTMGKFQQVVNKLHVYGNHPAVFNIPANDDTEKGFIEFSPYTYDDNSIPTIAGAPAHFAPYDWHDHLADTGAHGCMQVHRILDPADQLRPAQVIFAYNAFTANGGNDQNTVLGIGNFSQSFQSSSTDWTNLHQAEKCNATAYSVRNIEIWVKAAASDDSGKSYDTIEDAINEGTPDAQGVTQITINAGDEPMAIDITQIGGKAFKLKGTSEGTVTWTETATKTASGKYISYKDGVMTVKEGTFPSVNFAENGLQAAALGIDVDDATDKPYLKSVQDDSTTMVKFNFYHGTAVNGIITPTGIGGLPVMYAVEFADSSDFLTGKSETEPTTESSVSVALPTDTNKKTRYYRPKFSFGN